MIDTTRQQVVRRFNVGPNSQALDSVAIEPGGRTAWLLSATSAEIVPVDTSTGRLGSPVEVGSKPVAMTFMGTHTALLLTWTTLWHLDTRTDTLLRPITLPVEHLTAATSDERHFVDLLVGRVAIPTFLAVSPDRSTAYVANGNDYVIPIDLRSGTLGRPIAVPEAGQVFPIRGGRLWVIGPSSAALLDSAGRRLVTLSARWVVAGELTPNQRTLYLLMSTSVDAGHLPPTPCDLPRSIDLATSTTPKRYAATPMYINRAASDVPSTGGTLSRSQAQSTLTEVCPRLPGQPPPLLPFGEGYSQADVGAVVALDASSGTVESTTYVAVAPAAFELVAKAANAWVVGIECGDALANPVDLRTGKIGASLLVQNGGLVCERGY